MQAHVGKEGVDFQRNRANVGGGIEAAMNPSSVGYSFTTVVGTLNFAVSFHALNEDSVVAVEYCG